MEFKQCSKCKRIFTHNLFYKSSKSKDGYGSHCTFCREVDRKQRYAKDPEGHKRKARERYHQNKPRARAWYYKNKQHVKEYEQRLRGTIKGRARKTACQRKKEAKRRNIPYDLTTEDLVQQWQKQGGICTISGVKMPLDTLKGLRPESPSLDRVDPSKGYVKGNVEWVCFRVNTMKHDGTMEDLYNWCKLILAYRVPREESM